VRARRLYQRGDVGKINVTPMIDVVMVLIIFFLLVGQLAAEKLSIVDLPATERGRSGQREDPVVVNVVKRAEAAGGGALVVVEQAELSLPELLVLLRDRSAKGPVEVRLRADRSLAFADVRPTLETCRDAGVASVRLAAIASGTGGAP